MAFWVSSFLRSSKDFFRTFGFRRERKCTSSLSDEEAVEIWDWVVEDFELWEKDNFPRSVRLRLEGLLEQLFLNKKFRKQAKRMGRKIKGNVANREEKILVIRVGFILLLFFLGWFLVARTLARGQNSHLDIPLSSIERENIAIGEESKEALSEEIPIQWNFLPKTLSWNLYRAGLIKQADTFSYLHVEGSLLNQDRAISELQVQVNGVNSMGKTIFSQSLPVVRDRFSLKRTRDEIPLNLHSALFETGGDTTISQLNFSISNLKYASASETYADIPIPVEYDEFKQDKQISILQRSQIIHKGYGRNYYYLTLAVKNVGIAPISSLRAVLRWEDEGEKFYEETHWLALPSELGIPIEGTRIVDLISLQSSSGNPRTLTKIKVMAGDGF